MATGPEEHAPERPTTDPTASLHYDSRPEMLVGETIGQYRLVEPILPVGGMGAVFVAEQTGPIRRQVALKIIRVDREDSPEYLARFESERQAMAAMSHPNIARIFDAGVTDGGRPYMVMEYVPGMPITRYCDQHRLPLPDRLALFLQVCEALQHAHQKAIIHRDVKPSNVLVTLVDQHAVTKVIDFGLAKALNLRLSDRPYVTEQGQVIGTPEYMSPEQAGMTGAPLDTLTDIYSLGVLLYELLIGATPFDSRTLRDLPIDRLLHTIRNVEPPRPSTRLSGLGGDADEIARERRTDARELLRSLRGDLDWITLRAMDKDPVRRYASASELAADIRRFQRHEPVLAGPPSPIYRMRKFARRHRTAVIAGAAIVGVLALSVVLVSLFAVGETRARRDADRSLVDMREAEQRSASLTADLWVATESSPLNPARWFESERVGALLALAREEAARGRALRTTEEAGAATDAFILAVRRWDEARRLHVKSVDALVLDAASAAGAGRFADAERSLAKASRYRALDAELTTLYLDWARARLSRDTLDEARRAVAAAAALAPASDAVREVESAVHVLELRLVPIAPGRFVMGSSPGSGLSYERPAHAVTIERGFLLSATEITVGQFRAVLGRMPPGASDLERPVEGVTWYDAVAFCNALSARERRSPRYRIEMLETTESGAIVEAVVEPVPGDGYRLPSEAEWEYGCRAGTTTAYSFGDDAEPYAAVDPYMWFLDNSDDATHPVGRKLPNAWGLHDMHGNVIEWCEDTWHGNYESAPGDQRSRLGGDPTLRVTRGGGFSSTAGFCRSAVRGRLAPGQANIQSIGFRVARDPDR